MTAVQIVAAIVVPVVLAAGGWWVARSGQREQTAVEKVKAKATVDAEAERQATARAAQGGTIRSSEAVTLWDEATKIRSYLAGELEKRDARIHELEEAVDECRATAEECSRAAREAEKLVMACEEREALLRRGLQDARNRLKAAGL